MRKRRAVEGDIPIAYFDKRREPVSEQHLTDIFSDVGKEHGYYDVVARFEKRPKVTWQRSYRWTRFDGYEKGEMTLDELVLRLRPWKYNGAMEI